MAALRSPSAPSSMSSSSSRATSRIQSLRTWRCRSSSVRGCRAGIDRKVKCFFIWVDALAKTLMNELQEEHEEWLPMLPRMVVAATRDPEEETEGEARNDRELAVELRMLKKKVRKLKDQAQIPICN
uniref:Uncharacterized protein n=1 Tax=Aegilops tauschii TaxID=37682 RepID=R7WF76_AEGTA